MEFVDRVLKCNDCGAEFVFTAGEQLFFHDKQFKNDPKHCKQCKAKRASGGRVRSETRTTCSACGTGNYGALQAYPGAACSLPRLLPEAGQSPISCSPCSPRVAYYTVQLTAVQRDVGPAGLLAHLAARLLQCPVSDVMAIVHAFKMNLRQRFISPSQGFVQ